MFVHVYENIVFEQKKINLWNKWHFVENKAEIILHVLKMLFISLLPKYINEFLGVSSMNAGL
jgi:hypothetical protein